MYTHIYAPRDPAVRVPASWTPQAIALPYGLPDGCLLYCNRSFYSPVQMFPGLPQTAALSPRCPCISKCHSLRKSDLGYKYPSRFWLFIIKFFFYPCRRPRFNLFKPVFRNLERTFITVLLEQAFRFIQHCVEIMI